MLITPSVTSDIHPTIAPTKPIDPPFETAVVFTPIVPNVPVKTLEPFSPEQEKQFEMFRVELTEIAARWSMIDKGGVRQDNRELSRLLCFEMRSLACALGALAARANDCGVNRQPLSKEIGQLRNKMSVSRSYANETYDSLLFEDKYWTAPQSSLTSDAWQELAERYDLPSKAQTAWNWYAAAYKMPEADVAPPSDAALPLLNAIAAVQQALYRKLYDLALREPAGRSA